MYAFNEYYNRYFTTLYFPNEFNQTLDDIIFHPSLREIYFGGFNSIFNQNLSNVILPNNFICFCYKNYNENTINSLPYGLTKLKIYNISYPINNLPLSIQKIYVPYEQQDNIHLIKMPFGCTIKFF